MYLYSYKLKQMALKLDKNKKVEEVNTEAPQRQNDIYLTLNRHKKRFIKNLLRGTTFFEQLLQFTI